MKKTYDDNIFLCSDRKDRKIKAHMVSGSYYTDDSGFTIFELDQTKRDFDNSRITIKEGCFLLTEDACYKIVSVFIPDKRPKRLVCTTVLTDRRTIPHFCRFNFQDGTYMHRGVRQSASA